MSARKYTVVALLMSSERWKYIMSKNVENLPLSHPRNGWVWSTMSENASLASKFKNAVNEWISEEDTLVIRPIALKELSVLDILAPDLVKYILEYFNTRGDEGVESGGMDIIREMAKFAEVNKTWNEFAVDIQRRIFNSPRFTFVVKQTRHTTLVAFFKRIQPERLYERIRSKHVMTSAILRASRDSPSIRIKHVDGYAFCTGLIDPTNIAFSLLETIYGAESVPSERVLTFLQRLEESKYNIPLREFNVQMLNDGTDLAEVASFLPPSLKTFPMPTEASSRSAEAYGRLAVARCRGLETFVGTECAQFGKGTLNGLTELTTLVKVNFVLSNNVPIKRACSSIAAMLLNNEELENLEISTNVLLSLSVSHFPCTEMPRNWDEKYMQVTMDRIPVKRRPEIYAKLSVRGDRWLRFGE